MDNNFQDRIDEYLLHGDAMSEEAKAQFLKEIEEDAEKKEQYEFTKSVRQAVTSRGEKLKAMAEFQKEMKRGNRNVWLWVSSAAAVLVVGFFTVKNKKIRYGLAAIKGIGLSAIDSIVAERNLHGRYTSFENFISRCESKVLNKRLVENLIYAGAFDAFGLYRTQMIGMSEQLIERVSLIAKQRESNQMSLFGDVLKEDATFTVTYPKLNEYDHKTKLSLEKSVVGVYVSGHPLDGYADKFRDCTFNTSFLQNTEEDEDGNEVFTDVKNDMQVYLGGIITGVTKTNTKSGSTMNFVTVEDRYGAIECVFFPKKYEKYQTLLREEQLIKIKGRLQIRDGNKVSSILPKA